MIKTDNNGKGLKSKVYYIYIVECLNGSLYTGVTTDIQRRYMEHSKKIGAKYTKAFNVKNLKAIWKTKLFENTRSIASKLEYNIKKLKRDDKLLLIDDNKYFKMFFENSLDIDMYVRIKNKEIKNLMKR